MNNLVCLHGKTEFEPKIISASIDGVIDFLLETDELYNKELAYNIMNFYEKEPIYNFLNFTEASIVLSQYQKYDLAKICRNIAYREKSLIKGVSTMMIEHSALECSVRKHTCNKKDGTTDKNKYLYVLEFANGTIKIGITNEKDKRLKAIQSASGMEIKRKYFTNVIENVHILETELHRHFKNNRLKGEFFSVSYEDAVAEVIKRL